MNSKTEENYEEVFSQLVKKIKIHSNLKSFFDIKIMSDFELPMRKAIKKCFDGCLLNGCFFHYCRAIWKKIKKLNLFKKALRKNTMILAFILKSYPFIKDERREEYCNMIDTYCNSLKGNYIKLNKYFNKYWRNCKLFNFTNLDNDKIKIRTNNIIESFHRKINHEIEHYHPKTSFLIEELKRITKTYYMEYIDNLSSIKNSENEKHYIAQDIFRFIKNFVDLNKANFHLDNLVQYLDNDKNNFTNLMISILETVGDFNDDIGDDIKNIFVNENIINENESEGEIDKEAEDNKSHSENMDLEVKNKKEKIDELSGFDANLINGDVLLEEKIKNKKKRKKDNSKGQVINILNNLEYNE